MANSQELISQLLKAEQEAEALIATAKKNRQSKLKQAKEKAEEDLKVFRDEQEKKFEEKMGSKMKSDPTAELKGATDAEIAKVKQDYETNKKRTIEYVISKVLDVPTGLTSTQKMALSMGTV